MLLRQKLTRDNGIQLLYIILKQQLFSRKYSLTVLKPYANFDYSRYNLVMGRNT